MDPQVLENRFTCMGSRLKIEHTPWRNFAIDIQEDRKGEFFALRVNPGADLDIDVVDLRAAEQHLLLLVKEEGVKQKFLCGHDERHWFVAAVPERGGVSNVETAMEVLKPPMVREAQTRKKVKMKHRKRRKNAAYIRQGEWFFVPQPDLQVNDKLALRNEPLRRGGGKPHTADFCYRIGGETVYVCHHHPNGLGVEDYQKLRARNPEARKWYWQVMRRNPEVYVKGRIRHSDHKTVVLGFWHRVLMNTENESRAMKNVAFLD